MRETSLLRMNPQEIYTPTPIQIALAIRNSFQNLAIRNKKPRILAFVIAGCDCTLRAEPDIAGTYRYRYYMQRSKPRDMIEATVLSFCWILVMIEHRFLRTYR